MHLFLDEFAGDIYHIYGVLFLVLGAVAATMPRRDARLPFARDLWLISAFCLLYGVLELLSERYLVGQGLHEIAPRVAAGWLAVSYVPLLEFGRRQLQAVLRASRSPKVAWMRAPLVYGVAVAAVAGLTLWTGNPVAGLAAAARYFLGMPGAVLSGASLLMSLRATKDNPTARAVRTHLWIIALVALAFGMLTPLMAKSDPTLPAWLPTGRHLVGLGVSPAAPHALAAVLLVCALFALSYATQVSVRTIESGLSQSEVLLAKAQQLAQIGSWELDLRTNVLHWSDQIFRIFEIDPARSPASYEAFLETIHPEDREAVNAAYTESLRTREPYNITHRLRMADGRIKHVQERCETEYDATDKPVRSVGTVQDITERVVADSALRESEARYRRIVENSNEGIFIVDAGSRFTFVNRRMAEMLGVPPEQLLGRPIRDFIPPDELADSRERLAQRRRGIAERYERHYVRADGSQITVQISSVPVFDGEQKFAGSTNMAVDITERKRLEQQFLQAQKMEAVGRLAGGVAHDFNNLLTVILGYASMLQRNIPPASPMRSHVEQIAKAGERSRELTQRMLIFSRHQVLQLQAMTLNEIVNGMEPMLRRVVGEDIDLDVKLDPAPGIVRVDPGQMEQVIMNLVVNARDAMPSGGRLAIEVAREALDEGYAHEHPEVRPGSYVRLAVTDTGEGMSKAALEHLFEPFFTTKPPGKGTGLGLSTIYGIVRNVGGHVWVYSELGHGTTFKVYLPEATGDQTAVPPQHLASIKGGHETILMAEDEPAVRDLVRLILEESGYRVLAARDAAQALELCQAHSGKIDLLLTDIVMPHGGGRELAEQVRARIPGIHVIFMSGYTGETAMGAGLLLPGSRFVQKPILPDALRTQVREALDG